MVPIISHGINKGTKIAKATDFSFGAEIRYKERIVGTFTEKSSEGKPGERKGSLASMSSERK
jgi:hypothetical protein